MGVRVIVADGEPISSAARRFFKTVDRDGLNWEMRRRREFLDGTASRRAKEFKRRFRAREATLPAKMAGEQPTKLAASHLIGEFWRQPESRERHAHPAEPIWPASRQPPNLALQ